MFISKRELHRIYDRLEQLEANTECRLYNISCSSTMRYPAGKLIKMLIDYLGIEFHDRECTEAKFIKPKSRVIGW